MVFDPSRRDLKKFQRWVVTGLYRAVPFDEYDANRKGPVRERDPDMFELAEASNVPSSAPSPEVK
jgi:hypothetical protein